MVKKAQSVTTAPDSFFTKSLLRNMRAGILLVSIDLCEPSAR